MDFKQALKITNLEYSQFAKSIMQELFGNQFCDFKEKKHSPFHSTRHLVQMTSAFSHPGLFVRLSNCQTETEPTNLEG